MTAKDEYLEALIQMRETMVAARRQFAAKGNVDEVVDYQLKIDAIQRAIEDEQVKPTPSAATYGTTGDRG